MKNFQQNLLITLALCLCGMCVWQWKFQTLQRDMLAVRNQTIVQKNLDIQNYTNSLHVMDGKVAEMDQRIAELKQSLMATNQILIARERDIARLSALNDTLTNDIPQYTNAIATLETRLKEAYDGITKQNAAIQELTSQRDEFVKKYNDSVKDRNDIVARYNDVVARLNQLLSATNAPGR
jgi:chromosome segregation ATPase